MRRKDREVTDSAKIDEIISSCDVCRLGFNDNGRVYIVPLSFGFENDGGRRIFYFHSARGAQDSPYTRNALCRF